MNENPTLPTVRITVEDALLLMVHELERDDLERAMGWAALALSANDRKEPPDA